MSIFLHLCQDHQQTYYGNLFFKFGRICERGKFANDALNIFNLPKCTLKETYYSVKRDLLAKEHVVTVDVQCYTFEKKLNTTPPGAYETGYTV
jgi:hypothetical protein